MRFGLFLGFAAGLLLLGACGGGNGNGGRPVIASFTASPGELPAGGGSVTLSWSVSGADQIVIDPGVGPVTGSSVEIPVTATTFFMLSASNGKGTTTKSAVVMVGPASTKPVILSFTAADPNLPQGGGRTMLTWQVLNADSLAIDHDVGAVTGESIGVDVTGTTIYTLTATNADGSTTATAAVVIGQNPARSSGGLRYSALMSPTSGESFVAPATLRLVAAALDETASGASSVPGTGRAATKVQFFVDDDVVLEVPRESGEFWIFKGFASGVPAGTHRVWARSIHTGPDEVFDSPPALITVSEPPAYAETMDLDADVVLSGGTGFELSGAPDRRIRLNGNGHRISSPSGGQISGSITLKYVDVYDLGSRANTAQPAREVTTSGVVTIEDSIFDNSNQIRVTQAEPGTVTIRRNLFRSNMRMPLSQNPDPTYSDKPSFPVMQLSGPSTGAKVFAGNNVGAGWVHFLIAKNWTVGGDTDEDSNVLIGPRVGIHVQRSANMQVRRNFSHHVYYGGWSQGNDFELQDTPTLTVEHNVIYGSSWPLRGTGGEIRYNLILDAGHQWLWADSSNGYIHHNIFVGGESDGGGIWVSYQPQNVRIHNNTFDAQMNTHFISPIIRMQNGMVSLTSNLFMNLRTGPTVLVESGTLTADYSLFFNPQTQNYSDGRQPGHDVAGGAQTDPMLTDPPQVIFDLDEAAVWKRTLPVREVLSRYRMRYAPRAGSPVIDAGDPAGGGGNDIGAVGGGEPNASDRFGLF